MMVLLTLKAFDAFDLEPLAYVRFFLDSDRAAIVSLGIQVLPFPITIVPHMVDNSRELTMSTMQGK